jgi:hypothetical protein
MAAFGVGGAEEEKINWEEDCPGSRVRNENLVVAKIQKVSL